MVGWYFDGLDRDSIVFCVFRVILFGSGLNVIDYISNVNSGV